MLQAQINKKFPGAKTDVATVQQCYDVWHTHLSRLTLIPAQVMRKTYFIKKSMQRLSQCQSQYKSSQKRTNIYQPSLFLLSSANSPCHAFRENELILFSRVNTMLQATSNILRLEGMQAKKDLESQVRDILDEIGRDASRRQQVMSTPQV